MYFYRLAKKNQERWKLKGTHTSASGLCWYSFVWL